MIEIPNCPTCAIVMTYDRCARQHSCVRCGATIDAAYVSGTPVRLSPPQTLADREIAAAPPRFVLMRGADAIGRYGARVLGEDAFPPGSIAQMRHVQDYAESAQPDAFHVVMADDVQPKTGAWFGSWFVVDMGMPRVTRAEIAALAPEYVSGAPAADSYRPPSWLCRCGRAPHGECDGALALRPQPPIADAPEASFAEDARGGYAIATSDADSGWRRMRPRYVVRRGAELDGHLSIGPFRDAGSARNGIADIEAGIAGNVGPHWNRRDQRGGPPREGWFVVDTEAPATYRTRPIPADDLSAAARANVDYLWAAQARELMQTPLRDARRKRATIETIAPPPPGVPVEYPVTIANAPPTDAEILDEQLATSMLRTAAAFADSVLGPTDAEIVAAMESRAQREGDTSAWVRVNGGPVIDPDVAGAAWSRVLASKVAASDEKRRLDAMVYGPIDDLDEV